MTKGWNEVAWNEVVMERSDRIPFTAMPLGLNDRRCSVYNGRRQIYQKSVGFQRVGVLLKARATFPCAFSDSLRLIEVELTNFDILKFSLARGSGE